MRNLFDRNKSCLFQNIEDGYVKMPPNYQLNDLMEIYPTYNRGQTNDLAPFYEEFCGLLDVHLFDRPFDLKKKYYFERKQNWDVLVLRFEDIEEWPRILHETLGLNINQVPQVNMRQAPLYLPFKRAYHYSEEEVRIMRQVDFMRHFYKSDEPQ